MRSKSVVAVARDLGLEGRAARRPSSAGRSSSTRRQVGEVPGADDGVELGLELRVEVARGHASAAGGRRPGRGCGRTGPRAAGRCRSGRSPGSPPSARRASSTPTMSRWPCTMRRSSDRPVSTSWHSARIARTSSIGRAVEVAEVAGIEERGRGRRTCARAYSASSGTRTARRYRARMRRTPRRPCAVAVPSLYAPARGVRRRPTTPPAAARRRPPTVDGRARTTTSTFDADELRRPTPAASSVDLRRTTGSIAHTLLVKGEVAASSSPWATPTAAPSTLAGGQLRAVLRHRRPRGGRHGGRARRHAEPSSGRRA